MASPSGTAHPSDNERSSSALLLSEADWKFLMGDDGTGNCRGCGKSIGIIDPDCRVCMIALAAFMDEEPDFPALMEAARAC